MSKREHDRPSRQAAPSSTAEPDAVHDAQTATDTAGVRAENQEASRDRVDLLVAQTRERVASMEVRRDATQARRTDRLGSTADDTPR